MPKQSERRVLCDVAGGHAGSDTNKVGEGSERGGCGTGPRCHDAAARPLISELGTIRPNLDDLIDSFVLGEDKVVLLGDGRRDKSGGRGRGQ